MTFPAVIRGAILALSLVFFTAGNADATGIVPLSGTQQFDKDSSPPAYLTGGQLFVYLPGTTTPASVFSDFLMTTPLPSPIVLNTAGRIPPIYAADGSVRLRLLSSTSVLQFDDDNVALVTAAVSTTPVVVTADQLWSFADVKVRFDDQPVSGYVRCNGRTIGSATSGASERASADTQNLFNFLWTFANISVVAGKGASASADWSANKQLTLPDCAGRLLAARDDLGAGAKGRITALTVTGPTLVGATGGTETTLLDTTMVPAHTHASPAVTNPTHQHFIANNDTSITPLAGSTYEAANNNIGSTSAYTLAGTATVASVGLTSPTSANVSLAATTGSTGGGLAHNNLSPVMLFTIYLKL